MKQTYLYKYINTFRSCTLAFTVLLSIILSANASAQYTYVKDGMNFMLSQTEPYEASFIGFNGNMDHVNIPTYVEYNGNKYPVVSIFLPPGNRSIAQLTLPSTIRRFEGEWEWERIDRVNVADIHTWLNISFPPKDSYVIKDDKKYCDTSIYCNPFKAGAELYVDGRLASNVIIPEDVTEIKEGAFYNATFLESLDVKGKVTKVGVSSFEQCNNLKKVNIDHIWDWTPNTFLKGTWECSLSFNGDSGSDEWGPKKYFDVCTSPTLYAHSLSIKGLQVGNILTFDEESVTIGAGALAGISNLSTLDFKKTPKAIEPDAFYQSNVRYLRLPSYKEWFQVNPPVSIFNENISSLTVDSKWTDALIIPNGIATDIHPAEFKNFRIISQAAIGDKVRSIGEAAFQGCDNLNKLILGSGMQVIEAKAFADCTRLRAVYSLSKVPPALNGSYHFNQEAFSYATLYVPIGSSLAYAYSDWKIFDRIEEVDFSKMELYPQEEETDFAEADGLSYLLNTPTQRQATLKEVPTFRKDVTIPSVVTKDGVTYKVTTLKFKASPYLEYVSLPNTITCSNADWTEASSLKTITVDDLRSWMQIDMKSEIQSPGQLSEIYTYAYTGNPLYYFKDINVIVSDQMSEPGDYKLTIPSGIEEIKPSSFMNWRVKDLVFEDDVPHKIGRDAFTGFEVSKIVINDIDSWAESSKISDVRYIFDSDNPFLAINAFPAYSYTLNTPFNLDTPIYNETGMTSDIELSGGVKQIADGAFANMAVTSITLPTSLESIGKLAFFNTSLSRISIPDNVTAMGEGCFMNAPLEYISVGNGISTIPEYALSTKTLKEIHLGKNVSEIADNSLYYPLKKNDQSTDPSSTKPSLESIYIEAPAPPKVVVSNIYDFLNFADNYYTVLYVPKGCTSKYSEAPYWSLFKNIVEVEYSGVDALERESAPPFHLIGNTLVIDKEEIHGNFSICSIDGKVISRDATRSHTLTHGIYIVVCGNRSYKIAV
ncbi:MAG: leucine-rich repeat domain-containing protein [Muribaculum sp.]|nr:leucine-rich repeat domain-containing protein [Muribaculum sp.]